MTSKPTPRAGIYCRISSDPSGQALGVARQRKLCEELAEREGWDVAAVFVDNDKSAYSGRVRPEYVNLIDAIETGAIDAVVCWHPDRLHRSTLELEGFITLVERHGVQISTCQSGRYDLSTPSGRGTAKIIGSVAQMESEHKSARIKARNQQKREQGVCVSARAAFGYDSIDRVTPDPIEAPIYLELVERTIAGASLRSLTKWLVDEGVPTHGQKNNFKDPKPWSSSSVKTMLLNPRYAGLLAQAAPKPLNWKVIGEGNWEPLIDVATHRRLVKILTDPKRRKNRAARNYLLSGMVRCGRCGESFVSAGRKNKDGSRRREMVCRRDPGSASCGRGKIVAEPLEVFVSDSLVVGLERFRGQLADLEATRTAGGGVDAAAMLADLDQREVELAEAFAEGGLPIEAWNAGRKSIADQRANAERSLPSSTLISAPVRLLLDADDPAAVFAEFDLEDQRIVLKALVDHVRIDPPVEGNRYRWDAGRVHVAWKR